MSTLPPQWIYIYGLRCPVTGDIRYVGKTNNPEYRLSQHLREQSDTHKAHWIRQLTDVGLQPTLEILKTVPFAEWRVAERKWVTQLRDAGHALTNIMAGGYGPDSFPAETRTRISATLKTRWATMTPEERATELAKRPSKKGQPLSESHRIAVVSSIRGRTISSEEHDLRSSVRKAWWAGRTPEERSTYVQNQPKKRGAKSSFKGVTWRGDRNLWVARVMLRGKNQYAGAFPTEEEAARAYDAKVREVFGPNAQVNFPGPVSEPENT